MRMGITRVQTFLKAFLVPKAIDTVIRTVWFTDRQCNVHIRKDDGQNILLIEKVYMNIIHNQFFRQLNRGL